jgi:hypothetical protein
MICGDWGSNSSFHSHHTLLASRFHVLSHALASLDKLPPVTEKNNFIAAQIREVFSGDLAKQFKQPEDLGTCKLLLQGTHVVVWCVWQVSIVQRGRILGLTATVES